MNKFINFIDMLVKDNIGKKAIPHKNYRIKYISPYILLDRIFELTDEGTNTEKL